MRRRHNPAAITSTDTFLGCFPRRGTVLASVAVASLLVVGAGSTQTVKSDPDRLAAMHDHFRAAMAMQAAAIRGDLDALRRPAGELAGLALPANLNPGVRRHVDSIRLLAADAEAARNATVAAAATARVLAACGSCHRAAGTMPAISSPRLPSIGGTVGHMLEHQRAVDLLLRGLVVPSTSEWQQGARALRAAPLHARERPRDVELVPELLRIEEAVHRLAEEAVGAEDTDNRARIYGTLLARCADCHTLHRKIWGPPGK
jgi:mono/diheme cytochrome c family protein